MAYFSSSRVGLVGVSVSRATMGRMNFPPLDDRSALLRERIRSLPVSAFEQTSESDLCGSMGDLFGPDASAQSMVYCDDLSAWLNGCTVIVRLPQPVGGVAWFTYDEHSQRYWGDLSIGKRLDVALVLPHRTRTFESMTELCLRLTTEVGAVMEHCDDQDAAQISLNDWNSIWALRHALDLLTPQERSTHFMVAGLSLSPRSSQLVTATLARADRWVSNLSCEDSIEATVHAAVLRHNGVTLTGKQIQDLSPAESLMNAEPASWAQAADVFVAARYADGLDETYHPPRPAPPAPAREDRGSSTGGHGEGWSMMNVLAV